MNRREFIKMAGKVLLGITVPAYISGCIEKEESFECSLEATVQNVYPSAVDVLEHTYCEIDTDKGTLFSENPSNVCNELEKGKKYEFLIDGNYSIYYVGSTGKSVGFVTLTRPKVIGILNK